MANSIQLQELHSKGKTIIDYDDDLKYIVSAGQDGKIKIYSLSTNEVIINYSIPSLVKCVVIEKERIFIGLGNRIEIRSIVNQSANGHVFVSFTSNVNEIQLNKRKTKLVSCSDDCNIKLINLINEDNSKREIIFAGHSGPVSSVAISCNDYYLASTGCDGFLTIWNLMSGETVKSLPIIEKCAEISNMKHRYKLKWHPNDEKVLGITMGNEIKFVVVQDNDVCVVSNSLLCNESVINDFAFNNEGNFIVGGTRNGWIFIWDVIARNILMKWRNSRKSEIETVTWSGTTCIIFSDFNGCWEMFQLNFDQLSSTSAINEEIDNSSLTMEEMNEMFDLSPEKEEVAHPDLDKTLQNINDSDDDQKELEESTESVHNDSLKLSDEEYIEPDDNEDNEISLADLKAEFETPVKSGNSSPPQQIIKIVRQSRRPHPPIISTMCPRNGDKQILLWNPIAALKNHFDSEDEYNCFLEVDFQDQSVNCNLIYRHSVMRYELGDVNRYAVMLISKQASGGIRFTDDHYVDDIDCQQPGDSDNEEEDEEEEEEEDDQQAVIHVQPLTGTPWTEWNARLPSSREKVIGCCLVGQIYAIVMTNKCLRYFMSNTGGIEVNIESISGSPVAIISSSSYVFSKSTRMDNFIRVVIVIDDGCQLLWRMELFKSTDQPVKWTNKGKLTAIFATSPWNMLPLSQSSTLTWIGFSDSGVLFTVDSDQVVRRLHLEINETYKTFSEPQWTPVLDLQSALPDDSSRSVDRYFPIGVMDRGENCCLLAVHCLDSQYPTIVPWQHLSTVDFRLSICGEQNSELLELENGLLLNQIIPDWTDTDNISSLEISEKKLLLKLFVNAVLQDQDSRAFSIVKLMPDSEIIELAIQYAARNNKQYLAEKMGELARQREEEMNLVTEELTDFEENVTEQEEIENVEPELSEEAIDEDEDTLNSPGSFVTSPCTQKLKLKTKRRSSSSIESPLDKVLKK